MLLEGQIYVPLEQVSLFIDPYFHYDTQEDERREKNKYCLGGKKPVNFHEQKFMNAIN